MNIPHLPVFTLMLAVISVAGASAAERPNVLFIAVDDLRPQLGCYGESRMVTPNIDRLASQGTIFERSYCMVPTCGASRASLMTGLRPARNRFVNYLTWAERDAPGIPTLNTHFKANGYFTLSNGKVFHHPEDQSEGWSEPAWRPKGAPQYRDPANQKLKSPKDRGPAYEAFDAGDDDYNDGLIARRAIEDLQRLKQQAQPFFLAVGFLKPHLPFVAPQKYWDLYPPKSIHLPEPYAAPQDAPENAIHTFGELRSYYGIPPKGILPEDLARTLIRGYYACVSYTDAQIGRVLDELNRLELADNTIVVLWGDHGWNLGEHTLWCKHCCFETSMRAPLIVRAPGLPGGQKTAGLTEFIDIYPSLCELADLPRPEHLQGRSFVPLLRDPQQPWKESAIGRFQNGDTIRTDRYRFTEYTTRDGETLTDMLYDHSVDPDETVNLSKRDELSSEVRALTRRLREGQGQNSPAQRRNR